MQCVVMPKRQTEKDAKHMLFPEEKPVYFIQSRQVVADPFVGRKEDETVASKYAKRRAIILGHQTMGKVAGTVGTAMLADAARPIVGGREYSHLLKSHVKAKGLKPNKNVVYFPERGFTTQIGAERRHWDRMHGKEVTKGPKKGQILRGDELRYYGKQARKAKAGTALVTYSKIAKFTGYGHAYGLRPRGLATPWDYVIFPGLLEQDVRTTFEYAKEREKVNRERLASLGQGLAGASLAYTAMGGSPERVATAALIKVMMS